MNKLVPLDDVEYFYYLEDKRNILHSAFDKIRMKVRDKENNFRRKKEIEELVLN